MIKFQNSNNNQFLNLNYLKYIGDLNIDVWSLPARPAGGFAI